MKNHTLNWTEAQLDDALAAARAQWEATVEQEGGATTADAALMEQAERAHEAGDASYFRVLIAAREYGETGTLTRDAVERTALSVCIRQGCSDLRSQAGDAECFAHHYEPWGEAYQREERDRRDGYGY